MSIEYKIKNCPNCFICIIRNSELRIKKPIERSSKIQEAKNRNLNESDHKVNLLRIKKG